MRLLVRTIATAFLAAGLLASVAGGVRAEPFPLRIATGGVTGIYYQIGAAICRLLRDHPPEVPIACTTEGSAGSVRNLIALRYGQAPLAVVQGDSLFHAVRGQESFAMAGPDRRTRALFTVVTETFNVLARAGEATSLGDLRGRRLDIGPGTSGTAATFRHLVAERGWREGDFAALTAFPGGLRAEALCAGRTDGLVFVEANPSPAMQEATHACATSLVPVGRGFAAAMAIQYPYYVDAEIPGGIYPGNPEPVPTIGVRATLVAAVDTPDEVVHAVTRAVLDNLADLRTLHLAFAEVTLDAVTRHCVFAPLHAGTRRYLAERGLAIPVCPEVQSAGRPTRGG